MWNTHTRLRFFGISPAIDRFWDRINQKLMKAIQQLQMTRLQNAFDK